MNAKWGAPGTRFSEVTVTCSAIVPEGYEEEAMRQLADEVIGACMAVRHDTVVDKEGYSMFSFQAAPEGTDWSDVTEWACPSCTPEEEG